MLRVLIFLLLLFALSILLKSLLKFFVSYKKLKSNFSILEQENKQQESINETNIVEADFEELNNSDDNKSK
ncbi:MAG: hypothetical protein ACP5P3_00555 [Ignavibacteria bacterium]